MIGPGVAARRLEVSATALARDARAGEALSVELTANRPLRCTPIWPPGEPALLEPLTPARVALALPTRGVLGTVSVRLATAAPLGLLWWSVDRVVALSVPVEVAPRIGTGSTHTGGVSHVGEGRGRRIPTGSGDLRGLRPYRSGDNRRRVHWRGTAHTGQLMVRESELQPDASVRIVADLPDDPKTAEQPRRGGHGDGVGAARRRPSRLSRNSRGGYAALRLPVSDRRHAGRRLLAPGVNPYPDDRVTSIRERGGLIDMVRKANQPLPPENSGLFRVSTLVAVSPVSSPVPTSARSP